MKITGVNVERTGHVFDFELENGTLLHSSEWNGEVYTVKEDGKETTYKPVYRYEAENIDLNDLFEENPDEWQRAVEVVEFN